MMNLPLLDPNYFYLPALGNFYLDPANLNSQSNLLLPVLPNTSNQNTSPSDRMPTSLSSSFRICDLLENSSNSSLNQPDPSPNSIKSESSVSASPGPISPNTERSGSPGSSGSKKTRKARTIFTDKQLQELENTFEKQKYLPVFERIELAQQMGLSDTQVKTWYQNRRTKWKRQATTGIALLKEPGNWAAATDSVRSSPYWSSLVPNIPNIPMPSLLPLGMSMPLMLPNDKNFANLSNVPPSLMNFALSTSPQMFSSVVKSSSPPQQTNRSPSSS